MKSDNESSKYITTEEAAVVLGVSPRTIRRYINGGLLAWKRKDLRGNLVQQQSLEKFKYNLNHPQIQSTA